MISYGYAEDNNLLSTTYTNAKNATPNVCFVYDPAYNRRVSMTDGPGTTTYGYYPVSGQSLGAGKLESVAGPLPNSTIAYTYDELGRVLGRTINGAANQTSLVYDALGRVTSETNGLGMFSTAYVDETARPASLTYPNGQSTVYSYFNNLGDQRLQEIKNLGGATTLSQFDYTYDAEGEILTWARQTGASNSYALGYDLAGQLTSAKLTGASPQMYAYAYDPAANRTNETIGSSPAPVTVNDLNELVSRTGSNARSFAYDSDGELISNTGTTRSSINYTFSWDAENRLIGITYPTTNQSTQFTYDGLGRRVKIVEKTSSTVNSTKQFVWDGKSLVEERDVAGNLTKRFYLQGQVNGATALFYTRDQLGSVREIVNGSDVLQTRYEYDPYGRRTLVSGTDVSDFGFTGHYYHAPSAMNLTRYRSYNADLGRWLSRDPLGEQDDANIFDYVSNGPAAKKDPSGLCPANTCDKWRIVPLRIVSFGDGPTALRADFRLEADSSCCIEPHVRSYRFVGFGLGIGLKFGFAANPRDDVDEGRSFRTTCIDWTAHNGVGRITSAGITIGVGGSHLFADIPQGGVIDFGWAPELFFDFGLATTIGAWTVL